MKEQNIKNNITVQLVPATPSSSLLVNDRDMNILHSERRKLIKEIIRRTEFLLDLRFSRQ
jgi:hypothetical protein